MWYFQCSIWILDWKVWKISSSGLNWKPGFGIVRREENTILERIWKYLNKLRHWFLVLAVPKFCLWSFPSLCKQDEGNPGDEIHWGRGRAQSNKWVIVYLPPPPPPPPTLSKSYSTDLAIRERSWRPLSSAYSPGSQLKPNKTRNYLKFNFKTTPASQAKQIK